MTERRWLSSVWLDDLRRDLRHAARAFRTDPGFASMVVLVLAVGLGANTAIFSLVEALVLRPLPVHQPRDLVFLDAIGRQGGGAAPPYPYFERFRERASSFTGLAAFATDELKVVVDGRAEQVFGQVASGRYFETLGLRPAAGRLMTADDERLDPAVAVIGYGYWQRRFGGRLDAIGQQLTFDERVYTIVGVTPASFWGLEPGRRVDVTLPITQNRRQLANADAQWFNAIGRLRPDVPVEQAARETTSIFRSFMEDRDRAGERWRSGFVRAALTTAASGQSPVRSRFSAPLLVLGAASGVLLLITCINVGGLLVVRSTARAREFAVRAAAGAGAGRLLRQVLTETAVLFLVGAALGLLLAYASVQGLSAFFATGRRPILLNPDFNWRVASYTVALTSATALLTGLWPALRAARAAPHAAMKGHPARVPGRWSLATGRLVIASQVALSILLLVSAVIFGRTLANLRAVDLGFTPGRVLTMSLTPEAPGEASTEARAQSWSETLERVVALPDVRAASLSVLTPLSGRNTGTMLTMPGSPSRVDVRLNHVSEEYFQVFGIDLVAGRAFSREDASGRTNAVILNQTAATAAFGEEPPVGKVVELGDSGRYQVVGIVRDHKHLTLREATVPFAFVAVAQAAEPFSRLTLAVSSAQSQAALLRNVSAAVLAVQRGTLITDVIGIEDQIDSTLLGERLLSTLATLFAALVLAVSALGLYGIVSYSVVRRKAELGVRLALGAPRVRVASAVMGEVLFQVALGLAIGVPLAFAAGRAGEQLLFGVTAADPVNYAISAGVLLSVALTAAALPARRACSIDPAETLRGN